MNIERHHLSALFPNMQPAEYAALRDDIKAYGQLHPIIVFEGAVLDGWQRYRALCELGIDPRIEPFPGDELDALHYVIAVNLCRANPTPDQLAVVAVEIEAMQATLVHGTAA